MTVAQVRKLLAAAAGTRDEAADRVARHARAPARRTARPPMVATSTSKQNTLRVRRALKRTDDGLEASATKTARSQRTLQLSPLAVDALKAHKARQAEERLQAGEHWVGGDWLFTNGWGGPDRPRQLPAPVHRPCDRGGIGHWTPHAARHTAGRSCSNMAPTSKSCPSTLGHSSIRVTADVYAHLLPERSGEAVDALTRALA